MSDRGTAVLTDQADVGTDVRRRLEAESGGVADDARNAAALDDDADSPAYIETVPRVGYRFSAEVSGRTSRRSGRLRPLRGVAPGRDAFVDHFRAPGLLFFFLF